MNNERTFLGWLFDMVLGILRILLILGIWAAPIWFKITLAVLLLAGSGAYFSFFKIAFSVVEVLIFMDVWVAPMWVRITMAILLAIGIGSSLKDCS